MRCNATVFVTHPAFEHLALINILSAQTPARMMEVNFFSSLLQTHAVKRQHGVVGVRCCPR